MFLLNLSEHVDYLEPKLIICIKKCSYLLATRN